VWFEKVSMALRVAARTSWIRVLVHVALLSFLVEFVNDIPRFGDGLVRPSVPFSLIQCFPRGIVGLSASVVRQGGYELLCDPQMRRATSL
jgi:hypothetical protein